jgi:hypothetical protein
MIGGKKNNKMSGAFYPWYYLQLLFLFQVSVLQVGLPGLYL